MSATEQQGKSPTATGGVWRVMRFEKPSGKYCEVASNHLGPEDIPVPPGYAFVSSTPMVPAEQVENMRAGIRSVLSSLPFQPPEAVAELVALKLQHFAFDDTDAEATS